MVGIVLWTAVRKQASWNGDPVYKSERESGDKIRSRDAGGGFHLL